MAVSSTGPSTMVAADKINTDSPKLAAKTYHVPEKITEGLSQIRDELYRIEDQQMVFIDQLEVNVFFLNKYKCTCTGPSSGLIVAQRAYNNTSPFADITNQIRRRSTI